MAYTLDFIRLVLEVNKTRVFEIENFNNWQLCSSWNVFTYIQDYWLGHRVFFLKKRSFNANWSFQQCLSEKKMLYLYWTDCRNERSTRFRCPVTFSFHPYRWLSPIVRFVVEPRTYIGTTYKYTSTACHVLNFIIRVYVAYNLQIMILDHMSCRIEPFVVTSHLWIFEDVDHDRWS